MTVADEKKQQQWQRATFLVLSRCAHHDGSQTSQSRFHLVITSTCALATGRGNSGRLITYHAQAGRQTRAAVTVRPALAFGSRLLYFCIRLDPWLWQMHMQMQMHTQLKMKCSKLTGDSLVHRTVRRSATGRSRAKDGHRPSYLSARDL